MNFARVSSPTNSVNREATTMYTLIRNAGVKRALVDEAVPLLLSFGVAEMFYKFHSFMLETGAFLLTWLVVSYAGSLIKARFIRNG